MLGGNDHERRPEQGVRARRVHLEGAGGGHLELDDRSFGAPDPVALHDAHLLGPVDGVEVVDEPVGVRGDAHHPLAQAPFEDGEVPPLGAPLGGHFLVGQDGSQAGAPIDGGLADVRQAVPVEHLALLAFVELGPRTAVVEGSRARIEGRAQLRDGAGRSPSAAVAPLGLGVEPGVVDLQEDPLRPADVVDVGGGQGAPRVVRQSDPAELASHVRDVLLGRDARVLPGLHGVLFGGQAEGVVSHGVQDVLPEHPLVARDGVGGDVSERVAHVQALARGVGEHVEDVVLVPSDVAFEVSHGVRSVERPLCLPSRLPRGLDFVRQLGRVPERRRFGGEVLPAHHAPSLSTLRHRLTQTVHPHPVCPL